MKRPDLSAPPGLARAAAELATIVAGVLIALGAQSWWDGRTLVGDRTAALEALHSDLTLAAAELRSDLARGDTVDAGIHWILDPDTDFDTASDSLFNLHLRYALWEIAASEMTLPSYEDLKGSGRLGLLPPDVREGLAVLEARIQALAGTDTDNFQYQIRNLDPWLLDNAPLRDLLEYDEPGPRRGERMSTELLRSRRVENMLLAKLELLENLRRGIGRTLDRIDDVLERIEVGG